MILLHDLDGTHLDWQVKFNSHAAERYPHIKFPFLDKVTDWNLMAGLDQEGRDAVESVLSQSGFYADLEPYEGSVEAIDALEAAGHTNYFLSSPYVNNVTCASDKFASVRKHYGVTMAKRTILTNDKTTVRGHLLFDDKPEITGVFGTPLWEQIVFEQDYNRHHLGARRSIKSWAPDEYMPIIENTERRWMAFDETMGAIHA